MLIKFGKSDILASWELPADGSTPILKSASATSVPSFYATPGSIGTLNIQDALAKVAKEYDISANPADYMYEAVRALTANVPNENGDAFHKGELQRFDHRLGCAVYQTFILKPHHVNHKTDNPKTARGVILDAHYNDDSPALPSCPACNARTAEKEDRDPTGIHCKKCGQVVKDEFVEILIAIDKKKDPAFADGVRTGQLNATSMGCVCDSTTCNVCQHVAYSKAEFCKHIRSGKKKVFKTASGDKVAFEWCNNVTFTEQSRVDQPADPKALQREVLQLAAAIDTEKARGSLADETQLLIMSKKIADLQVRIAQLTPPSTPTPDVNPQVEPGTIEEFVEHQDGKEENADPMSLAEMGIKNTPGAGGAGMIETFASIARDAERDLDQILNTASVKVDNSTGAQNMPTNSFVFRSAYKDIKAHVTEQGNVRVSNAQGTLFSVTPTTTLTDKAAQTKYATELLCDIAANGLLHTMKAYAVTQSPKIASILDSGLEDFEGGREGGDKKPMPEGGDNDRKDDAGSPEKSPLKGGETDRASKAPPEKASDGITTEHAEDFEDGRENPEKSVAGEHHFTQKEGPKTRGVSDSTLDDEAHDHKERVAQLEEEAASDEASKSEPSKKEPSKKPSKEKSEKKGPPAPKKGPDEKAAVPGNSGVPGADPVDQAFDNVQAPATDGAVPPVDAGPVPAPAAPMGGGVTLMPEDIQAMVASGMMPQELAQMLMEYGQAQGGPGGKVAKEWKKPWEKGSKVSKEGCGSKCGTSKCSCKKAAKADPVKSLETRLERLYRARIAKVQTEANSKVEKVADGVAVKFQRALKLAAARQRLNLEYSPIKAAFADALLQPMDLNASEYYPGMDEGTATALIERAASEGMEEFVDALVTRAAELVKMSDDTFGALEADVNNLQPVTPPISRMETTAENKNLRQAARSGNLHIAPSSPDAVTPKQERTARADVRGALAGTTVTRRGPGSR